MNIEISQLPILSRFVIPTHVLTKALDSSSELLGVQRYYDDDEIVIEGISLSREDIRLLGQIKGFERFHEKLLKILREQDRRSLMVSLLAKAMCRTRGHTVITTGYSKCGHFREIEDAIAEVSHKEIALKPHYIEEMMDFERFSSIYAGLLSDQFNVTVVSFGYEDDFFYISAGLER